MGCQSYQVHPFEIGVTLPYSGVCHFKNVITKVTRELPPAECETLKGHSLILTTEAWRVIRTDIKNNCAQTQCTELIGKVDALFLAADSALDKLPF